MRAARFVHLDFEPMYNTVTARNKASRTIQDSKRSEATYAADIGGGSSGAASNSRGQEIAMMLHGEQSTGAGKQIQQQQPSNHQFQVPQLSVDLLQEISPPMQSIISSQTLVHHLASDFFFMNDSTFFQPLGLVRALETNFVGHSWHES